MSPSFPDFGSSVRALTAPAKQSAPAARRVARRRVAARKEQRAGQVQRVEQAAGALEAHARPARDLAQRRRVALEPADRRGERAARRRQLPLARDSKR